MTCMFVPYRRKIRIEEFSRQKFERLPPVAKLGAGRPNFLALWFVQSAIISESNTIVCKRIRSA